MAQPAVSGSGLITGEAVVLDLRPARIGSRSVAALVDLIVESVALGFLLAALTWIASSDPRFLRALAIVVALVLLVGYPVIALAYFQGRTIGKAMLGIRVVRTDGGTVRARHAAVRTLIGLVEFPLGVAALVSLCSTTGRRLGDVFAGTAVVHDRIPLLGRQALVMPPPLVNWALNADFSGVDERLATDVRSFLGRAPLLRVDRRWELSAAFANAVVAKVSPPPPAGAPPEHVLHAVMAETQRRRVVRSMPVYTPPMAPYSAPMAPHSSPYSSPQYPRYADGRPPPPPTAPPAPAPYTPTPPAPFAQPAPPATEDTGGFTLPG